MGPGNWDWNSPLRHIASGGHNVGDVVNGMRWNGEKWEGGGSSGGGAQSYIQDAINMMKKANEPLVASYKEQIPEIQTKFSKQRESIKSRYDNLIASIKGNQTTAETRQTTTTNNELGRRGITMSSGVAQQEMTNALNPITQQYTGMVKEATQAQGDEQQASMDAETEGIRAINNLIAQLEAGATQSGISTGLNLFGMDQQAAESQRARDLQAKLAEADNAFREKQFAESVRQFNTQEARMNKGSGGSGDITELFKTLGIGNTPAPTPQPMRSQGINIPAIGKSVVGYLSDGRALYSDGSAGWSYAKK